MIYPKETITPNTCVFHHGSRRNLALSWMEMEPNLGDGSEQPPKSLKFEEWMVTDGYKECAPVREYLDFLHEMREAFIGVQAGLKYKNAQGEA